MRPNVRNLPTLLPIRISMPNLAIAGLRIAPEAAPAVNAALKDVSAAAKTALKAAFKRAAGTDSNARLDLAEASLVSAAIAKATKQGQLDLAELKSFVDQAVAGQRALATPAGVKAYFSSTTPDMRGVIIDAMKDTVARAAGRPVEINILIFSFVDPMIGNAMKDIAAANPNVHFRLIADFGDLSDGQNHQPPALAKAGLPGLSIKYKKDAPYVWDEKNKRPRYDHNSTKGLNHHKGFVAYIDGQPDQLVTGSLNWSPTADDSNYENVLVFDAKNAINRRLIAAFQAEFVAFYNSPSALNTAQAKAHRAELTNQMRAEHGLPPLTVPPAGPAEANYVPVAPGLSFDVNDLSDAGYAKLKAAVKSSTMAAAIAGEIASYGPVRSLEELRARVKKLGALPAAEQAALQSSMVFGEGSVPINTASADELVRWLGIKKTQAVAIVAKRSSVGEMESLAGLSGVPGLTPAVLEKIGVRCSARTGQAFFSARPYGAPEAQRGWAPENAARTVPQSGPTGVVTEAPASLSAGIVDLMNRAKPGDEVKIAMYGISSSTPEYAAVVAAAKRGVDVRLVLNDDFNGGVALALTALEAAGTPIHVRIQKARTMHEKFGVVNDDVFDGSANFSSSSAEKHTEDRFVLKNDQALAQTFHDEFELLWSKSKPVVV